MCRFILKLTMVVEKNRNSFIFASESRRQQIFFRTRSSTKTTDLDEFSFFFTFSRVRAVRAIQVGSGEKLCGGSN